MRISLLNYNLSSRDAIGSCLIAQARFFLQRGDIVHIFTEHSPEDPPADIAPLCRTVSLAQLRQDRDGVFTASDMYIYHYGLRHSLMETITEVDGGLVVFYYHNVTPPELWNLEEERANLRRGVEGVELAAYADLVLSDSEYNLAELARSVTLAPERLIKLPLPVNVRIFHPGAAPEDLRYKYGLGDRPVLLYVGRMAPNKRIDLLVDLLAAVQKHPVHPQPNARLLLVGDSDSSPAYTMEVARALQRARTLGVGHAVVVAGLVNRLPDHYRLASVYVTTSQHEGFCVPLIEAMASGVPTVAVASTAIPETLGDAGLLVPTDPEGAANVAEMANDVVRVLSDPNLAQELRKSGLARAGEFGVEQYVERMEAIIGKYCTDLPLRVQPAPYVQMAETAVDGVIVAPETPLELTEPQAPAPAAQEEVGSGMIYWPELADAAQIARPDYVVRSKLPILGRLVEWVRRNLTSHLKEPYIDPIILRQQAYNQQSNWTINELTRRIAQLNRQVKILPDLQIQVAQIIAARDRPQPEQVLSQGQAQARLRDLPEDAKVTRKLLEDLREELLQTEKRISELQDQLAEIDQRG